MSDEPDPLHSMRESLAITQRSEDISTEQLGKERTLYATTRAQFPAVSRVPPLIDPFLDLLSARARSLAASQANFDAAVGVREATEKLLRAAEALMTDAEDQLGEP